MSSGAIMDSNNNRLVVVTKLYCILVECFYTVGKRHELYEVM